MKLWVAVTGHQNLGEEEVASWVSEAADCLIRKYEVDKAFTSLAKGADQIFARRFLAAGVRYVAVVPCEGYERTFETPEDLESFKQLLQEASEVVVLDFAAPSEDAFFEAGKYAIDQADIVFAVWNGKSAAGRGGTADAVGYAIDCKKKVVHINNIEKTVEEI